MNVNKVTATVKYTQDTGKGAWKSLELGCEASIDERENWQSAQATLYSQLASQFKALWATNGTTPETHQEGHRINGERSEPMSSWWCCGGVVLCVVCVFGQDLPAHFCQEHGVEFKPRNGPHGEFYSHKTPDGRWCNESSRK